MSAVDAPPTIAGQIKAHKEIAGKEWGQNQIDFVGMTAHALAARQENMEVLVAQIGGCDCLAPGLAFDRVPTCGRHARGIILTCMHFAQRTDRKAPFVPRRPSALAKACPKNSKIYAAPAKAVDSQKKGNFRQATYLYVVL
jgi:hypothetical protein